MSGTKLKMSTAFHPQTDEQSEVVNRGIESYLRAIIHETPKRWLEMLLWDELWHNSTHNESISMSPFMALYGKEANTFISAHTENTTNPTVEEELIKREKIGELVF